MNKLIFACLIMVPIFILQSCEESDESKRARWVLTLDSNYAANEAEINAYYESIEQLRLNEKAEYVSVHERGLGLDSLLYRKYWKMIENELILSPDFEGPQNIEPPIVIHENADMILFNDTIWQEGEASFRSSFYCFYEEMRWLSEKYFGGEWDERIADAESDFHIVNRRDMFLQAMFMIEKIEELDYILMIKRRLHIPGKDGFTFFSPGISFATVDIYDIRKREFIHRFFLLAENSESIYTYSHGDQEPDMEKEIEKDLINNLFGNVIHNIQNVIPNAKDFDQNNNGLTKDSTATNSGY